MQGKNTVHTVSHFVTNDKQTCCAEERCTFFWYSLYWLEPSRVDGGFGLRNVSRQDGECYLVKNSNKFTYVARTIDFSGRCSLKGLIYYYVVVGGTITAFPATALRRIYTPNVAASYLHFHSLYVPHDQVGQTGSLHLELSIFFMMRSVVFRFYQIT